MALLGWFLGLATLGGVGYIGLHPTALNRPLTVIGVLLIGVGTARDEIWWDSMRSWGLLLIWLVLAWTWLIVEGLWPDVSPW
jgi:hypothetical protein